MKLALIFLLALVACGAPAPAAVEGRPPSSPPPVSSPSPTPYPKPTDEQLQKVAAELVALVASGDLETAGKEYVFLNAAYPNCRFAQWHGLTTRAILAKALAETRVKYPKAILATATKGRYGVLLGALCGGMNGGGGPPK